MQNEVAISVMASTAAESNRRAIELLAHLSSVLDDVPVKLAKADDSTMDAGTIVLAIVPVFLALAKDPAVELAKGIADWMRKRRCDVSVGPEGISISNVRPEDLESVLLKAIKSTSAK